MSYFLFDYVWSKIYKYSAVEGQIMEKYKICDKLDDFLNWYGAIDKIIKNMTNKLNGPFQVDASMIPNTVIMSVRE